ncbi:MAG: hypothetical protein HY231_08375 [Acidobacteria bacterium]|nr:hypothetical protein [Acidobacteriota bacterium]
MSEGQDQNVRLSQLVVRIQTGVLAVVFALLGGLGLFLMTVWLLVKGGENIGSHLNLLGQYLIGYSVTWTGSLIGLLYGLLIGGIIGGSVGKLYNLMARARQRAAKTRAK